MVRAEVNRADPELEELRVQPPSQSSQEIIKNQMKPAVGSKKLVRGLDLNDDDLVAARLQGTAGGRGGK